MSLMNFRLKNIVSRNKNDDDNDDDDDDDENEFMRH